MSWRLYTICIFYFSIFIYYRHIFIICTLHIPTHPLLFSPSRPPNYLGMMVAPHPPTAPDELTKERNFTTKNSLLSCQNPILSHKHTIYEQRACFVDNLMIIFMLRSIYARVVKFSNTDSKCVENLRQDV